MLESDNTIVGVSHHDHFSTGLAIAPLLRPQIEYVMQVDVSQKGRNHSTYAKGNFEFERVVTGWRASRPVLDLRLKR